MKTIAEGAEAQIIQIEENILKKIRLPKSYRLEIIDTKLRRFRNKREFKVLTRLFENNINVPKPIEILNEKETKEIAFTFQYINGNILKEVLNEKNLEIAFNEIIKMHNLDIVHGDLTTLNMIQSKENNQIYLIDFGLSQFSYKAEDKAVDLNLFFTCIKNEHPKFFNMKEKLIKIYLKKTENDEKTIKSLENIEHRGRNK